MLIQLTEPTDEVTTPQESLAIGIDLGTTHSVVAVVRDNHPQVLKLVQDTPLVPSVVYYPQEGMPLVGGNAQEALLNNPLQGIRSVKRLMSASSEMAPEHQALLDSMDGLPRLRMGSVVKTPVEISGDILYFLRLQAEKALHQTIHQAVITVPAYFDDAARQATKDAANLAGLNVLRLVNEPTAAALAYGLDKEIEGIYAVFDLGGGTFDLSLLRLTKGVFQVLATGGDTHLGGDDLDHLIAQHLFHNPTLEDLVRSRTIKHFLTTHEIWEEGKLRLDRSTFHDLCQPLFTKMFKICEKVFRDASLDPLSIQGVVLVGGATRMPGLQQRIEDFFGKAPLTDVNPDEVVAIGAALQAEALTLGSKNLLLDVTPLSLGIETMGGLVEKVIPRNTPIPALITHTFTTYENGQTHMKIHVLQGERERIEDCRSLGEFILSGIPPLPSGQARVDVTFKLDADGLLTVEATEQTTHIQQSITIKPSYGLTANQIEQMIMENATFRDEDRQARQLAQMRFEGERLGRLMEHALAQDKDLLTHEDFARLSQLLDKLVQACKQGPSEIIEGAIKALLQASEAFSSQRMQRITEKRD